jgi:hypothetical protein
MALTKYKKTFTPPKEAVNLRDLISGLLAGDFIEYLMAMRGTAIDLSIQPSAITSEKLKMYAYYQKVILSVAIECFTDIGWEGVDEVSADEILKTQVAKEFIHNPLTGEEMMFVEPKAKMTKDRLIKYINDCILFLESLGWRVPESDEYKAKMLTGVSGFESVKKRKRT